MILTKLSKAFKATKTQTSLYEGGSETLKHQEGGFLTGAQLGSLIAVAATIGAVIAFAVWERGHRGDEAINLASSLSTNIQAAYHGDPNGYTKITTAAAIGLINVQKGDVMNGNTIVTPWYGDDSQSTVTVTPGTDSGSFNLNFNSIPQHGCVQLGEWAINQYNTTLTVGGEAVTGITELSTSCQNAPVDVVITKS